MFKCPFCIHTFMGKTRFEDFENHIAKHHPMLIGRTYIIRKVSEPKKIKIIIDTTNFHMRDIKNPEERNDYRVIQ